MKPTSISVKEALLILNKGGEGSLPEQLLDLSKQLKKEKAFGYARRVLAIARQQTRLSADLRRRIDQQYALCTYKDKDLPVAGRLDKALHILQESVLSLDSTTDQETLGLAGAIYKRKWEADGQRKNLEASFYYYNKGCQQGAQNDDGYTSVNAAFILDLLAHSGRADALPSSPEEEISLSVYATKADEIRKYLLNILTGEEGDPVRKKAESNWWILVTIAEAYFGLRQYEAARPWLQKAIALPGISDWEIETTLRQLSRIAILHEGNNDSGLMDSAPWQALKVLITNPDEQLNALHSAFEGKVGLALSGGGFRASLYHIGVLAKLAELDVLRKVETLSCVSGGSIIGAHYYLEVRHLLQTKPDKQITRQDYIDIIQKISIDFLAGVQRNLRTRVISNWWNNCKMLWHKDYSRTNRIGELYEKELFSRVNDEGNTGERWLNNLFVCPMCEDGTPDTSFNPKYDNWRRYAKAPVLILNATTLNTGHNWQFTAAWMGESPATIQKIDGNYRLRRMYYKENGDEKYQRKIRLGYAVAASSCVPGMFEPLALPNLYKDKAVKLVDGGVHDNQGICGLLEQDCSVILVSDASGQMGEIDQPGSDVLSAPLRANDILMERVRNAEHEDMQNRLRAGLLSGFMFIHLKMGLDVQAIDWQNCEEPSEENTEHKTGAKITAYNIRKDIQKQLAAIRTDLDSFNDTEAFALMTSGYLMTACEFPRHTKGLRTAKDAAVNWCFLQVEEDLRRPDTSQSVLRLLEVAKSQTFKVWQLVPFLTFFTWVLLALAVAGFAAGMYHWYHTSVATVGEIGWIIIYAILGLFISKTIIHIVKYKETLIRFATGLGLITVGWMVANLHLLVFDKMYLNKGKRKCDYNITV